MGLANRQSIRFLWSVEVFRFNCFYNFDAWIEQLSKSYWQHWNVVAKRNVEFIIATILMNRRQHNPSSTKWISWIPTIKLNSIQLNRKMNAALQLHRIVYRCLPGIQLQQSHVFLLILYERKKNKIFIWNRFHLR